MKNLFKGLSLCAAFALALFAIACTADYDTFDESHYKVFNNIKFEEQDGDASIFADEHLIKVTMKQSNDSLQTWDSLTIGSFSVSNMASIHLVDGKFKEFPSDSIALDSLAQEVSYIEEKLNAGDKIRIPQSQVIYLMVVAENGDPSIWKIEIVIPREEITESSSSEELIESSSSSIVPSSSSVIVVKSSAKDFQITFKNQLKVNRSGDSILIKLVNGSDVALAILDTFSISEGASINPDPRSIDGWSEVKSFEVIAEDETSKTWFVEVSEAAADEIVSDEKELLSISAEGEDENAIVNQTEKTVVLHFPQGTNASAIKINLNVSESAFHNLSNVIDLREPVSFTITAEDGSSVAWTITAEIPLPPQIEPKILSMSIAGKVAQIDDIQKHIHIDDFDFRSDLTSLEITALDLSEYAACNFKVGSSYDFGMGQQLVVSNPQGDTETYTVKVGYQLPGSNFNSWDGDDVVPKEVWGNANTILTTTKKYSASSIVGAEIKTGGIGFKTASGSLYTADFNPNDVSIASMSSESTWPDGNELLDFGKPFTARPEYIEVQFSYNGSGDSCDIYILLENRTGDENINRKSTDVNKLVASAWYRSTTGNNTGRTNPDVVSVSEPNASGMRTLRLKLKYGTPLTGSPIENSSVFKTTLSSSKNTAINNGVIQGVGNEPVTHIRLVFASSADGNHYNGKKGAVLVVDEFRLIY